MTPSDPNANPTPARRTQLAPDAPRVLVVHPDLRCRLAVVHDVCGAGVGLILDEPPPVGAALAIHAENLGPLLDGVSGAEVRHVRQLRDGRWLAGCAITRRVSPDQVTALRQALAPAR
jgi:hypothetical protein